MIVIKIKIIAKANYKFHQQNNIFKGAFQLEDAFDLYALGF